MAMTRRCRSIWRANAAAAADTSARYRALSSISSAWVRQSPLNRAATA